MELSKMSKEEKIAKLRTFIKAEINLCDAEKTPYICKISSDTQEYPALEQRIVDLIIDQGYTIGTAIVALERILNPNLNDD